MTNRPIRMLTTLAAALLIPVCAPAQWINYRDPSIPRTSDGKPNLKAKAPHTREGKPDLSGIWQPEAASKAVLSRFFKDGVNGLGEDDPNIYFLNFLNDFPFENPPMTPSAATVFKARAAGMGRDHPAVHCGPWGLPMVDTEPGPSKIVQTPGVTYILYEDNMSHRQIYADGRKHTPDPQPSWL
jgi:hypothetical protein